jgi:uncharacterized protein with WD repeat
MWNVATNALISTFDAPDSTDVKWSPDGQHILTTTCAPRLRLDNILCTRMVVHPNLLYSTYAQSTYRKSG